MKTSGSAINLEWARIDRTERLCDERPWERGIRLAARLRSELGLARGPIAQRKLEELLNAKLPLRADWAGPRALRGGFRNDESFSRTTILVTSAREDSQRFYFARMAGAALTGLRREQVLPVSDARTALQKLQRAFAQEFLCPWEDLDAFTDQVGTDEDGSSEAASHFCVSEWVIASALQNRGKLSRGRAFLHGSSDDTHS